ncbi:MAG: hypothetical protein P8Z37_00075 [Acidobacteriota bacterium]
MIEPKTKTNAPKIWISYPWIHSEERDFSGITECLEENNFEAVYESIQIVPNAGILNKVEQKLQGFGFDGWICVLTHKSMTHRECTNELNNAIECVRQLMGPRYPILGLMYGIVSGQMPPVLRMLPCISLSDPNWHAHLRAAVHKYKFAALQQPKRDPMRFIWEVHNRYHGNESLTLIEVRTRGESIPEWRFAVPKSCRLVRWGQGTQAGCENTKVRFGEVHGTGTYKDNEVFWFGASNTVTNSECAYILLSGKLPDIICFGPARDTCGIPGKMEVFRPGCLEVGRAGISAVH